MDELFKPNLLTRPEQKKNHRYFESLDSDNRLEMLLVPGGRFLMGSPDAEEGRDAKEESPQNEVDVPNFCMGRYPITQAQWRAVASYPKVDIDLEPDPSRFKNQDNNPVEGISWFDAIEFCARLNVRAGEDYRLPSEAEWEYACRAGTSTPFHFGETLTDELAIYDAEGVYGRGSAGENRRGTVSVYELDAPNDFGLCHMHGNVWEWCQDIWHDSYENSPSDGSAWITNGNDERRVIRGGSWLYDPANCRSAVRDSNTPAFRYGSIGFRVVRVSRGTP